THRTTARTPLPSPPAEPHRPQPDRATGNPAPTAHTEPDTQYPSGRIREPSAPPAPGTQARTPTNPTSARAQTQSANEHPSAQDATTLAATMSAAPAPRLRAEPAQPTTAGHPRHPTLAIPARVEAARRARNAAQTLLAPTRAHT